MAQTDDMRGGRPLETTVRPALPVSLSLTIGPHRRGRGDPSWHVANGAWWHARRTPDGPATVRYGPATGGGVPVAAWGPGAERAIAEAPAVLGARDSLEGFAPARGLVAELHRTFPGLRVGRTGAVFASLLPTIVEQKVASAEAHRSYRRMVHALGEPAPGPQRLMLQPAPEVLARTPGWAYHPFGLEIRRAGVIRFAASRASRIEEVAGMAPRDARRRLLAFPGVGPWSAAEVALTALGDPDAVSVGDYHLPHLVSWALAGEARGTDERMLELLAPYAGHRGRVIRLLEAAGMGAPRFGPRMALRDIAKL
jgi:3-methyladenine DNA glycosylase/8-oxoguanine DNA glycosylase